MLACFVTRVFCGHLTVAILLKEEDLQLPDLAPFSDCLPFTLACMQGMGYWDCRCGHRSSWQVCCMALLCFKHPRHQMPLVIQELPLNVWCYGSCQWGLCVRFACRILCVYQLYINICQSDENTIMCIPSSFRLLRSYMSKFNGYEVMTEVSHHPHDGRAKGASAWRVQSCDYVIFIRDHCCC
jgi:hypothetical protein